MISIQYTGTGALKADFTDLFVGNHVVSPTEGVTHESPLAPLKPDQRYLALPIAQAMRTLSLIVPAELSTEILLSVLFWAGRSSTTSYTRVWNFTFQQ